MPVLFVGHGSPMNAIENNAFTKTLSELGARLPRPKAVCVVSAHWVTSGSHVLASEHPQTIHDFYGFPRPLYEVEYPAPGAPAEAEKLARNPVIVPDEKWGLDHGSWSVLRHMYPKADVPSFQLSLDDRRTLKEHLELGREIQSLRQAIYHPGLFLPLFGAIVLSAAFHEIGHAAACRYGGGMPGKMGCGLYLAWPAFYTDVTDAIGSASGHGCAPTWAACTSTWWSSW